MLLRDFIFNARTALSAASQGTSSSCGTAPLYSPEEAVALVSRLCEALLGVSSYAHIVHPEMAIPEESLPVLQAALERLTAGEPLQYVLGYADFLGMRLRVTPAVLIPRPETEELCRRVIASYSSDAPVSNSAPRAILDLCCGSGCITWAMARAFPDALVVGVDLSEEALDVARNQKLSLPAPIFIQSDVLNVSDLLRTLKSVLKKNGCNGFDLLLSNPPYVRENEREVMARNVLDFEPSMALFVPDDDALLFYRAIRDVWCSFVMRPQARLALEINEALGPETLSLFPIGESGLSPRLEKDFNEKNRYIFSKK